MLYEVITQGLRTPERLDSQQGAHDSGSLPFQRVHRDDLVRPAVPGCLALSLHHQLRAQARMRAATAARSRIPRKLLGCRIFPPGPRLVDGHPDPPDEGLRRMGPAVHVGREARMRLFDAHNHIQDA